MFLRILSIEVDADGVAVAVKRATERAIRRARHRRDTDVGTKTHYFAFIRRSVAHFLSKGVPVTLRFDDKVRLNIHLPHDIGFAGFDASGVLEVQVERTLGESCLVPLIGGVGVEFLDGESFERRACEAAEVEGQAQRGPTPIHQDGAVHERDALFLVVEGRYQVRVVRLVLQPDGKVAHERDVVRSEFAAPCPFIEDMEQRGFVFFEVIYPASAPCQVRRVSIAIHIRYVSAVIECIHADVFHSAADGHGGQAGTVLESAHTDARHATFDVQGGQVFTIRESIIADFAASDGHGGQAGTTPKSTFADARHAVGDGYRCQTGTARESAVADACHAAGDGHRGQTGTVQESAVADARHAVGDGQGGQTGTFLESTFADARHAVGDGHGGQARTIIESIVADARHATVDGQGGQIFTIIECTIADFAASDGY